MPRNERNWGSQRFGCSRKALLPLQCQYRGPCVSWDIVALHTQLLEGILWFIPAALSKGALWSHWKCAAPSPWALTVQLCLLLAFPLSPSECASRKRPSGWGRWWSLLDLCSVWISTCGTPEEWEAPGAQTPPGGVTPGSGWCEEDNPHLTAKGKKWMTGMSSQRGFTALALSFGDGRGCTRPVVQPWAVTGLRGFDLQVQPRSQVKGGTGGCRGWIAVLGMARSRTGGGSLGQWSFKVSKS